MNIVFLDIDGVLNNSDTEETILEDGSTISIDLNKVAIIKEICDKKNARIVIISSLRKLWDTADFSPINNIRAIAIDNIFKKYGLQIYGITGYSETGERQEEIKDWLEEHPEVKHFAIIDDDTSFYRGPYQAHLINTSKLNVGEMLNNMEDCLGVQSEHIPLAVKILEKNL